MPKIPSKQEIDDLKEKIFRYMQRCQKINDRAKTRSSEQRGWTQDEIGWKKNAREALDTLAKANGLSVPRREKIWTEVARLFRGEPFVTRTPITQVQKARRRR